VIEGEDGGERGERRGEQPSGSVVGGSLAGRLGGSWGELWGQDGRGGECGCLIGCIRLDGMVNGWVCERGEDAGRVQGKKEEWMGKREVVSAGG